MLGCHRTAVFCEMLYIKLLLIVTQKRVKYINKASPVNANISHASGEVKSFLIELPVIQINNSGSLSIKSCTKYL